MNSLIVMERDSFSWTIHLFSVYLRVRHSVRKLSGTRSLTVPRCKCEKAGTRNSMQDGRSIFVIGASIASPPGVCLSILLVLQDGSSREEAKISGAAQIENRPCLHGFLVPAFSLSPKQEFNYCSLRRPVCNPVLQMLQISGSVLH